MSKKENIITIILFSVFIFAGAILFWIIPDKNFSENENRKLSQMPKAELKTIASGEFMEEWEDYVSDQFPGRDMFMLCGGRYKNYLGMKDINGVYIGKDGYLFTVIDKYSVDNEQVDKNSRYINDFLKKCQNNESIKNTSFMLVPEAGMVIPDKLPNGVDNSWQWELVSHIRVLVDSATIICPEEAMRDANEQQYYKTDHHWTGYGAYNAYTQYCKTLNIPCDDTVDFTVASKEFYGSLYSKILFAEGPDEVVLDAGKNSVSITGDGKEMLLYDYSALEKKDKYLLFQGGNYGITEITGNGEGVLLIIKDSYANSFVPFLTNNYEKIIMLDMRYYMGSPLALCNKEGVTDVLVLYSLSNFVSDKNMIKLGL